MRRRPDDSEKRKLLLGQRQRGMQSVPLECLPRERSVKSAGCVKGWQSWFEREAARWSRLATSRASADTRRCCSSSRSFSHRAATLDCHNRSALHRYTSLAPPRIYILLTGSVPVIDPSVTFASDFLGVATCMQRLRQWLLRHEVSIDERLALVKGDDGSAAVTALADILPGTTRAFAALSSSPLQRTTSLLLADLCFCWGGKSQRFRSLLVSRTARPPSPYVPTRSMTSRKLSA